MRKLSLLALLGMIGMLARPIPTGWTVTTTARRARTLVLPREVAAR